MHIKKYKLQNLEGIARHDARNENEDVKSRSNESIDKNKTYLNTDLLENAMPDKSKTIKRFYERFNKVAHLKRNDLTAFVSIITTLPKKYDGNQMATKAFINGTLGFIQDKFGKENVFMAELHNDETTPHIHFGIIPVVYDNYNQTEKVNAKVLFNRYLFRTIHQEYKGYMEKAYPSYDWTDLYNEQKVSKRFFNLSTTQIKNSNLNENELGFINGTIFATRLIQNKMHYLYNDHYHEEIIMPDYINEPYLTETELKKTIRQYYEDLALKGLITKEVCDIIINSLIKKGINVDELME